MKRITLSLGALGLIGVLIVLGIYAVNIPLISGGNYRIELEQKYPELLECKNITEGYLSSNCYREIALKQNNSGICRLSPTELGISSCYTDIAEMNKDQKFCSEIKSGSQRDSCYFGIASLKSNPSICESIGTDSAKIRCLAIINNNETICSNLKSEFNRGWCYYAIFTKKQDYNICSRIASNSTRDKCYYEYVDNFRLGSGICDMITDSDLRKKCSEISMTVSCSSDGKPGQRMDHKM
jgi:hypothetical protein